MEGWRDVEEWRKLKLAKWKSCQGSWTLPGTVKTVCAIVAVSNIFHKHKLHQYFSLGCRKNKPSTNILNLRDYFLLILLSRLEVPLSAVPLSSSFLQANPQGNAVGRAARAFWRVPPFTASSSPTDPGCPGSLRSPSSKRGFRGNLIRLLKILTFICIFAC